MTDVRLTDPRSPMRDGATDGTAQSGRASADARLPGGALPWLGLVLDALRRERVNDHSHLSMFHL
jgi:hypothetical protein